MRLPWKKKDDMKNKLDIEKALAPASEQVQKSQSGVDRINRILRQAEIAQEIVKKQNMR